MLLFLLHVEERLAIIALHDLLDYFLLGKMNMMTMMLHYITESQLVYANYNIEIKYNSVLQ